MRILLVHPDSPFLVDSKTFPPLGILYLARALEDEFHEVSCVDLAHGSTLEGYNPQLIGISCVTPHVPMLSGLMKECRALYPGVPIIVGGPHFSTYPNDGDYYGADSTGLGDCEEALLRAVEDLEQGKKLNPRYSSDGLIADVNRWPIPARHLLPIHDYRYTIDGIRATTAITQRGCPYECTFCCHWEGYRKVRLRHTENVIVEVKVLKAMGFGAVMFYDDEFNLVHKRTMEVCDALKGEGIKWRAFIKANLFNPEQARAFAESGCWEVCTGVESGSDIILKTIQKKATVADNTRSRRLARDNGIRFKAFTMVGHPGETRESIEATKRWLIENAPDEFNVSLYTPYGGTPVVDHPERFDIQFSPVDYHKEEFFYRGKPGEYQPNTSTSALSGEELVRLRDEVENEVREALGLPSQGSAATFYTARSPDTVATTECG